MPETAKKTDAAPTASALDRGREGDPNTRLAERLKDIRTARGLSLQAAAKLSGVSRSMLSQIERGESSPTLSTLWNLARAFNVDVFNLIEGPVASRIAVRRAADQPAITDAARGCRLRILSPPERAQRHEMYTVDLDPDASLESAPHWLGCREHLVLISGSVTVHSGEDRANLSAGDVADYPADVPHAIVAGPDGARMFLIVKTDDTT